MRADDHPFLWEMLRHALCVPEGQQPPAQEVVRLSEPAHYV